MKIFISCIVLLLVSVGVFAFDEYESGIPQSFSNKCALDLPQGEVDYYNTFVSLISKLRYKYCLKASTYSSNIVLRRDLEKLIKDKNARDRFEIVTGVKARAIYDIIKDMEQINENESKKNPYKVGGSNQDTIFSNEIMKIVESGNPSLREKIEGVRETLLYVSQIRRDFKKEIKERVDEANAKEQSNLKRN